MTYQFFFLENWSHISEIESNSRRQDVDSITPLSCLNKGKESHHILKLLFLRFQNRIEKKTRKHISLQLPSWED